MIPLQAGIGAVSATAIVNASDGAVYFGSERGMYRYDGSFQLISQPIETTFFALNQGRIGSMVAIDNRKVGEIWFSVTSANAVVNDTILAYSYRLSTPERPVWFQFSGINAQSFGLIEDLVTDLPITYHGDQEGFVYYHDDSVDNDDGTAISATWTSGWLPLHPNQVDMVRVRNCLIWNTVTASAAGNLTTDLYPNLSSTSAVTETTALTATDRLLFQAALNAFALQLKLTQATAAQGFQVDKIAVGLSALSEERLQ